MQNFKSIDMKPTRLFDLLERFKYKYPYKKDVFAAKENGSWRKYSTNDYIDYSNWFSYGLLFHGFKKGDKIVTVSNNRPEWNFVDMGMNQVGGVHVPIYPTISDDEYIHILNHSKAKYVIVSSEELYNRIKPIVDKVETVDEIYTFDKVKDAKHWTEILEIGKKNENYVLRGKLKNIKDSIFEDDLATIIYTSGTTGLPKGVMLSHKNFLYQIHYISELVPLKSKHKAISFLPLCHVLERVGNYTFQYMGLGIYYAESIDKVADNINEIKPNIFITVPRLLEKVYDKIIAKGKDLEGIKKKLFFRAVDLGLEYELKGKSLSYQAKLEMYNALIFSKWRQALGGNIKLIISGGAALQTRLAKIFKAAKIPVYEGYGLSETAPVIAVNNPKSMKFNTVGPILGKEQQVKIADDGEILFKGPNLMLGYYNDPKKTKEIIDKDGWFHTGDIGTFVENKFLKITDRKKEMFKLSTGKYVAPQPIENILKESFFIEQAMIIGENKKYTSALIAPNFEFLHDWAHIKKIHYRDHEELIENPKVVARYTKEVDLYNERLGKTEKIKKFKLVCEEWSSETGILSPTLKLKRRFVKDRYKDKISKLYE